MATRHKHPLPETQWPSAEQARHSRLFSPCTIGSTQLVNRGWVPAMVPWRATPDGEVTPALLNWYARFADGQPGAIVVEATGIRDIASGPLLRASHDRFIPGLAALAAHIKERSQGKTRVFIQLIDFLQLRRRPGREDYFSRFLQVDPLLRTRLATVSGVPSLENSSEQEVRTALAALPTPDLDRVLSPRQLEDLHYGARERVDDMHIKSIAELPQTLPSLFAEAAQRAQAAGFDGIELHYAHAYTMASFLSRTNGRPDGYGGSRQGRVRLALEVLEAVRAGVGPDYVVGCRMLGDEVIEGGSRIDDARYYAQCFASAGMDFISVSKGGKFDDAAQPKVGQAMYPYTGPSGHECMPTVFISPPGPFGRNLHLAASIRESIHADGHPIPVVAAGGIGTFEAAEQALQSEACDLVGAARQSLADPDWWVKILTGQGHEVRRCKYTNYCEALDQRHKEVTCQLWDRSVSGLDDSELCADGKRRLTPPLWESKP